MLIHELMSYYVYTKVSDICCKFCAIHTCARCSNAQTGYIAHRPLYWSEMHGQMRQMRVRIRSTILSLYYQTMELPIGNAGSEFSRRFFALQCCHQRVFFPNVDLVWRLSENNREELVLWMIKHRRLYFFHSYDHKKVTYKFYILCTKVKC